MRFRSGICRSAAAELSSSRTITRWRGLRGTRYFSSGRIKDMRIHLSLREYYGGSGCPPAAANGADRADQDRHIESDAAVSNVIDVESAPIVEVQIRAPHDL